MRKTLKILAVVMVVAALMLPLALAFSAPSVSFDNTTSSVRGVIKGVAGNVSGIVYTVGIAIALVVIVVFGVQWIIATPAKKAELKGKAWNLVIGIAILVGATFILGAIGDFAAGIAGNKAITGGNTSTVGNEPNKDATGTEWP